METLAVPAGRLALMMAAAAVPVRMLVLVGDQVGEVLMSMRSVYCGEVKPADAGKEVSLCGWVNRRRDLGGLIFIDLRDRTGLLQVVFDPDRKDLFESASKLRGEFCVQITGTVRLRPESQRNSAMDTGEVEVEASALKIFNKSAALPIDFNQDNTEEQRLRFRYLDLRRPDMVRRLMMRAKVTRAVRDFMDVHGFIDIETPVLTKATPEGARDYLVPSRVHHGKFYALPQSPQLFKQLLMIAGYDRYYQIVKCFRDEDLRADRQPEFTQIDVETSFMSSADVRELMEEMVRYVFRTVINVELPPLPVLTWDEAMDRFGSDKPDLRIPFELHNLNDVAKDCGFSVLTDAIASKDGRVIGFALPGGAALTRRQLDGYTDLVKKLGLGGLLWIKTAADGVKASFSKHVSEEVLQKMCALCGAAEGDAVLVGSGSRLVCAGAMGTLRLRTAEDMHLVADGYKALWVVNFPMFEMTEEGISAMHHPFTAPTGVTPDELERDPLSVYADAYDIVINGYEAGGGSVRIFDAQMQQAVFRVLGINEAEAREKFGFLLDALSYGAPPHAGIAFGLDRMVMLITGADNIREVIAFPKTTAAACLMTGAPSRPSEQALNELAVAITDSED